MVNHWLCVTNDENWKIIKNKHVWGVSERHKALINTVNIGDSIIIYIKGGYIGGFFEAASNIYYEKKRIFNARARFASASPASHP